MPGKGIPAIVLGVFRVSDLIHVGPMIEGKLMQGHRLDLECACNPRQEHTRYAKIVIHYVIH